MELRYDVKNADLVAQRRREMSEAATALFWDQGFHGMSMRQLARTLQWNPATLYQYVASKEDLICLIAQDFVAEALQALERACVEGDPWERTFRLFHTYAEVAHERRVQIKVIHQGMAELNPDRRRWLFVQMKLIAEPFERVLRSAQIKGMDSTDLHLLACDLMLLADMWAIRAWALEDYRKERDFQDFLEHQRHFLARGLTALLSSTSSRECSDGAEQGGGGDGRHHDGGSESWRTS